MKERSFRKSLWFELGTLLIVLAVAILWVPMPHSLAQQEDRQLKREQQTQPSGATQRRIALVIGNGAYANAPVLKNPPNDARDIAKALSSLGFKVESGVDLTQKQMKAMIREFGKTLKDGGQGLFFFAGHGVQQRGRNYLIPVDADIQSETDVEDQGVDASLVLGLMDEANNGLNVVILDACRNNPFARSFRSASSGLAQVDAPTGTLIAYATAPGRVARDGTGRNGTFTSELLKQMDVPGLPVEELLKRVRANVKQKTDGEQVPWESSSLVGDFYLNQTTVASNTVYKTPGETTSVAANLAALEQEYWDTVKNSTDPEDFRDYLRAYPAGTHAVIAYSNLRRLETAGKTSSAGPANTGAVVPGTQQPQMMNLKRIISNETAEGSSITIFSDLPLDDYSAYRGGDRFYVLIPSADASRIESGLRGRGFEDVRTQKRGNDVLVSFRLLSGATAQVSQKFNRLEILISVPALVAANAAANSGNSNSNAGSQTDPSVNPRVANVAQASTTSTGKPFRNRHGIEMIWIPPGSFDMGSSNGGADEKPIHRVTISEGFYLGKYEVTQGQWKTVMGSNPSNFKGENLPVETVSWDDATAFIARLNAQDDGYSYRLPTEAEWEYACRAGTTGDYARDLDAMGWYGNNSGRARLDVAEILRADLANFGKRLLDNGAQTHAVGTKLPNAFGLFDMHGNVWEWCQDWYQDSYNGAPTDGSARLSGGEQKYRVLRGGSWNQTATNLRSAIRLSYTPDVRYFVNGFRLVAVVRTL